MWLNSFMIKSTQPPEIPESRINFMRSTFNFFKSLCRSLLHNNHFYDPSETKIIHYSGGFAVDIEEKISWEFSTYPWSNSVSNLNTLGRIGLFKILLSLGDNKIKFKLNRVRKLSFKNPLKAQNLVDWRQQFNSRIIYVNISVII